MRYHTTSTGNVVDVIDYTKDSGVMVRVVAKMDNTLSEMIRSCRSFKFAD